METAAFLLWFVVNGGKNTTLLGKFTEISI
jgi:hypothetical protein